MHQHGGGDQRQQHQREIFRGVEFQRDAGERRCEGGDEQRTDAAGDERADRRDRQRGARPPLACHLVAVDAGHHGGGFSGQVERIAVVEPP